MLRLARRLAVGVAEGTRSRGLAAAAHGGGSGVGGSGGGLTHVDADGKVAMVNVEDKPATKRVAVASARVWIGEEAWRQVEANAMKKGDVLAVARVAGVQGAKATSTLIPLCHPLALSVVDVQLAPSASRDAVDIRVEARTTGPTGVEMEALTGAAVAALTVVDMVKAVARGARIERVQVEHKSGGRSGAWDRSRDGDGSSAARLSSS